RQKYYERLFPLLAAVRAIYFRQHGALFTPSIHKEEQFHKNVVYCFYKWGCCPLMGGVGL
ncbi:MAG TPA: hypothetical protein PKI14_18205, partial [Fervidobacterium sp.]|nr:hypothetical protein [Fervidobacterium sp.]